MSQAAAKPRDPIDLDDFERKLRGSAPDAKFGEDPLQELSRLIGAQPDPFDRLFAAGNPGHQAQSQPQSGLRPAPRQLSSAPPPPPPGHRYEPQFDARQDGMQAGAPPLSGGSDANAFSELLSQFPDAPARFAAAHPADEGHAPYAYDPQGYAQPHQDMDPGMQAAYDDQAYADPSQRPPSRRPFYLMGAALIVMIGGIGAVLLHRTGNGAGGTPMIQASNAPVKVAPPAPRESLQAQQQQQAVSVLDKSNTERLAASRVVIREEQPVDIQATARAARAAESGASGSPLVAAPSGATASNGMFPEPRRVKTVSVRPDGSVITGEMASSPSAAAPGGRPASMASTPPALTPPPPSRPAAAATSDRAAIEKLAANAAQTPMPKATARATAPVVANVDNTPADAATPAASRPKPADAAKPKPADTTASTNGVYAAQLAAPASEEEARSVMKTLAKRYGGELGGHKLTFRKATVGEKTVYRVRAAGLSQEAANAICAKMSAKGGSCFVARN